MKRLFAVLLFAATSLTLAAQPSISSIEPASGPTAGGTLVTITGSGFAMCDICSPAFTPRVFFGGTPVYSQLVNANTLRVVTPAHLPGTVNVAIEQFNGHTSRPNAFTFTGAIEEGFHRVLLPLFLPPVDGAFGSRFVTELRLANSSTAMEATFFGFLPICNLSACIFNNPLEDPYAIEPGGSIDPREIQYRGEPGAFLYLPKSAPRLDANLRVYDETRSTLNFGTEIPVVYDREFTSEPFKLLGVPRDPNFRHMLRLYSNAETTVTVSYGSFSQTVTLHAGRTLLDPAYAQLTIPSDGGAPVDVTVTPLTAVPPMPGLVPPQVWAFISVTNNETQLISTITPQR